MQRLLLLPLFMSAVTSVARAEAPSRAYNDTEKAQRFQGNRNLIKAMVQLSVRLAEKDDPLDRAATCIELVDGLSAEVSRAAANRDATRVEELAGHLKTLLQWCVAFNLSSATVPIPADDEREPDLLKVGTDVKRITGQLESQLRGVTNREMQESVGKALKAVSAAQAEVAKALKGRGPY